MSNHTFKFTVFTPTYNRAVTLGRLFESLKQQAYTNFEWLLIDDGSTDHTEDVVKDFLKEKVPFEIVYKKQKNIDKFLTQSVAISLSRGKYFICIDSDDALRKDALSTLQKHEVCIDVKKGIVGVIGLAQYPNGKMVGDSFPISPMISSTLAMRYSRWSLMGDYDIKGDKCGFVMTEVLKKVLERLPLHIYEGKGFVPDMLWFVYIDALGYKLAFVNEKILIYHYTPEDKNSMSYHNIHDSQKYIFGRFEGFRACINTYKYKLYAYPALLFRNIIGYGFYGTKLCHPLPYLFKSIESIPIRIFFLIFFPLSYPLGRMYQNIRLIRAKKI